MALFHVIRAEGASYRVEECVAGQMRYRCMRCGKRSRKHSIHGQTFFSWKPQFAVWHGVVSSDEQDDRMIIWLRQCVAFSVDTCRPCAQSKRAKTIHMQRCTCFSSQVVEGRVGDRRASQPCNASVQAACPQSSGARSCLEQRFRVEPSCLRGEHINEMPSKMKKAVARRFRRHLSVVVQRAATGTLSPWLHGSSRPKTRHALSALVSGHARSSLKRCSAIIVSVSPLS